MRKLQIVGGLLLTLVLILSACAPKSTSTPAPAPQPSPSPAPAPSPQAGSWDAVLAAAKKEGTVTVYNVLGSDLEQALRTGMKQYGVGVQTVGGTGGELELRITTEQRAKAYIADILISGWTNNANTVKAGYGQPTAAALPALGQTDVWRQNPGSYDPTKNTYVFGTGVNTAIIINTDFVRKGEIASWQDLTDPKWKGRIVMTDGRTGSGPGASPLNAWSVLGEDFWKKIAAQNPTMQVNYSLPVQQVALGEKAIGLFPNSTGVVPAINAGAPIQIVNPKEGTTYNIKGVGIVKNAPHPNAATVLINWMLSQEGQAAVNRALGGYVVRKDVTENWFTIPELNPKNFILLEPPTNLDPDASPKGGQFATKIFGPR